ncbi:MAG: hypothetical protein FWJ70_09520 [Micromonosporaceae bacterium]
MTRALLRTLLIAAVGLLALAGTGTAATAAGGAVVAAQAAPGTVPCQIENPKWEVTGSAEGAETLRECGGTAGAAEPDALPLTGPTGRAGLAAAAVLVGLGAGLVASARRRRVTFAA